MVVLTSIPWPIAPTPLHRGGGVHPLCVAAMPSGVARDHGGSWQAQTRLTWLVALFE